MFTLLITYIYIYYILKFLPEIFVNKLLHLLSIRLLKSKPEKNKTFSLYYLLHIELD